MASVQHKQQKEHLHCNYTTNKTNKTPKMKKKFAFALAAAAALLTLGSLNSCKEEEGGVSKEDIAYFEKQRDFIRQKKAALDEQGSPLYKEIVYLKDTLLYRILEEPTSEKADVNESSVINMVLKGQFTDGSIFQKEMEMTYMPKQLVYGLRPVLVASQPGGKYEAILPASLGYGYQTQRGIRGGSTLIFTFKVKGIK